MASHTPRYSFCNDSGFIGAHESIANCRLPIADLLFASFLDLLSV